MVSGVCEGKLHANRCFPREGDKNWRCPDWCVECYRWRQLALNSHTRKEWFSEMRGQMPMNWVLEQMDMRLLIHLLPKPNIRRQKLADVGPCLAAKVTKWHRDRNGDQQILQPRYSLTLRHFLDLILKGFPRDFNLHGLSWNQQEIGASFYFARCARGQWPEGLFAICKVFPCNARYFGQSGVGFCSQGREARRAREGCVEGGEYMCGNGTLCLGGVCCQVR